MKKAVVIAVLGIPCLFASAYAQPLNIAVSAAQYTTYVQADEFLIFGTPLQNFDRTTISSIPISDEIDVPFEFDNPNNICRSAASCDVFSDYTYTGWGVANASATSQVWFSPLEDQSQTVTITYTDDTADRGDWGSLTLLDLTTGSELWNYGWSIGRGTSDTPGDEFDVETTFLASDQYELTMNVMTDAGYDEDNAQLQLTGLQVVPEPSTLELAGLGGLASLMAFRRRRNN